MVIVGRRKIESISLTIDDGERRIILAHEVITAERTPEGGVDVEMYGAKEGNTANETIGRVYLEGCEARDFEAVAGDRMGRLWY
ncbi:MAG: hypothetical protein ACR2GU_03680 [Rubrobacteraceae bacterium]